MSWFNNIETKILEAKIAERSTYGSDQINFLTSVITEFEHSKPREFMDTAWRYYHNDNDVNNDCRWVIGRNKDNQPTMTESKVLANNHLCHNFMKKLTRQKIGYMIGRPFILTPNVANDERAQKFFDACKPYFDETFYKRIKNVGRDSIVCGIGWIQIYYNEKGEFCQRLCAPEEVIPFWKDRDHTELDAVVRMYQIESYEKGSKVLRKYIEYYLPEGVFYYVQDIEGKNYIPDPERPGLQPHFIRQSPLGDRKGMVWNYIPFIPFKYDPDEQSLLSRIKSLIDDYDRKTSSISNSIDDFPNSLLVIKNYDGTTKEEFVAMMNNFRAIFVQGDGDAKSLQTPLDVEGVDKHLERLRQDIYEFGQGVNTADKDIRDTSGVALRFIYADLDMDCIDWGQEMRWSLRRLLWFIQQDIQDRTSEDYGDIDYSIVFNTDVIINETETITNCMNSRELISAKTIAENHPWVLDANKEVAGIHEDTETLLKLESEYQVKAKTNNPPEN